MVQCYNTGKLMWFECCDEHMEIQKKGSEFMSKTHLFGCGMTEKDIPKDKIVEITVGDKKIMFCDWDCMVRYFSDDYYWKMGKLLENDDNDVRSI